MRPLVSLVFLSILAAPPAPPARPAPVNDDEKLLREAKIATDGPGLLEFFRRRTLTAEQRRQLQALIPRLGEDDFEQRQQASAALAALGPAATAHLRRALDHPDEEVKERLRLTLAALAKDSRPAHAAAAARLLCGRAPAGAVAVLLAYLPEAADEAVEDEVLWTLAALGVVEGKVAAPLAEALKDREPGRRAAAAVILGRYGTAEQRTAVRGLLADPNPAVRFRAAQGLLAARDGAALPILAALAGDAAPAVAVRADELLAVVAGAHAPNQLPAADARGRAACQAAWESWVRRQGTAALARAAVDLPPANASLRAAAAGRRFYLALQRGDGDALKDAMDVPFLVGGENLLEGRGDVERVLAQFGQVLRDPSPPIAVCAVRFLSGVPHTVTPAERVFLGRFRRGELLPVALAWRPTERAPMACVGLMLWVRLSGPQPRVVGVTLRQ
jgi:HEAT repeat protein